MGNWERFGGINQQYSPYRSQWGQEGDGTYKHRGIIKVINTVQEGF